MTVLALILILIMWASEGEHMITFASILLVVVIIPAAMLMDAVMLFGPPESEPGVDRLLRYRPKAPPGREEDIKRLDETPFGRFPGRTSGVGESNSS